MTYQIELPARDLSNLVSFIEYGTVGLILFIGVIHLLHSRVRFSYTYSNPRYNIYTFVLLPTIITPTVNNLMALWCSPSNKFKVTVVISQQTAILNNLYLITKNPPVPRKVMDNSAKIKSYNIAAVGFSSAYSYRFWTNLQLSVAKGSCNRCADR